MKAAVFERALEHFRAELSDFDPALITTGDAARLFEVFSDIEKTAGAAKTMVAGRASVSEEWKKDGHRSPAAWMATKTGTAEGDVHGMIENSERLASLPQTTDALRKGELSGAQIREIVATAAVNPSAERELLEAT